MDSLEHICEYAMLLLFFFIYELCNNLDRFKYKIG